MTRWLMIVSGYPPAKSAGMERGCQRLAEALARRGHTVHVLTLASEGLPEHCTERGVEVHRALKPVAVGPMWGLSYVWQVSKWMRRHRDAWDACLCHKLYLHSAAAVRTARALGKPCATLLVNCGVFSDIAKLRAHKMGDRLVRMALGGNLYFHLSRESRAELMDEGVGQERLAAYRYFVDTEAFSPGGTKERNLFLSIGRLHPQKNLPLLLEAFRMARRSEHMEGWRLRIVGRGPLEAQLREWVAKHPYRDDIELVPWTDDPVTEFRRATATVMSSDAEGLSNVMVESLACGTPVLATDVSGVRDTLDIDGSIPVSSFLIGKGGVVVNRGDATGLCMGMLAIMKMNLAGTVGTKPRERALELFTEARCVDDFLAHAARMFERPR